MDVNALVATAETMEPAKPLRVGSLPAELESYEDAEDPAVRGGGWHIETIQSADWALARLCELKAEADALDAQARAAKERIEKRTAALKERIARGASYFEFKLLEYAETHRKALLGSGKKKSRAFVHGTVGWRTKNSGGRLVVKDPAALEAWLLAQPVEAGLYRPSIAPEMKALQALFREKGEIPAGCDVEPEIDEPYVKPEAPGTALVKGE